MILLKKKSKRKKTREATNAGPTIGRLCANESARPMSKTCASTTKSWSSKKDSKLRNKRVRKKRDFAKRSNASA